MSHQINASAILDAVYTSNVLASSYLPGIEDKRMYVRCSFTGGFLMANIVVEINKEVVLTTKDLGEAIKKYNSF